LKIVLIFIVDLLQKSQCCLRSCFDAHLMLHSAMLCCY